MPAPPWFKQRPQKWLATTIHLSIGAQGALMRLICHQWNLGALPLSDARQRATLMGLPKRDADRLWQELEQEFTPQPDGRWLHELTAADYVDATQQSAKRAAAGAKGAQSKWQKDGNAIKEPDGKPMATPSSADGIAAKTDGNAIPLAIVLPMASTRDQSTDLSTSKRESSVLDHPQKHSSEAPAPRHYAINRPRNLSAFFESSVFDIPKKWAQEAIRRSNGRLTEVELTQFAHHLSERVRANKEDVSAHGNMLAWLDKELHQWRGGRADSGRHAAQQATANQHLDKVKRMEAGVYGD